MSEQTDHHGHSPAAWVAVVIMLIAFAAGALFFWFDQPAAVIVSAVVLALGPLIGWMLSRAGYGVRGPRYTPKTHE